MKQNNALFYFSINDQFIPKNVPLPFDLFINSSALNDVTLFKNYTINYLEKAFNLGNDYSILNQIIINSAEALGHLVTIFAKMNLSEASKIISELAVHDFYIFDHSINVAIYTSIFYRHLYPKSSYEELISISLAALFHDIGKVKISNEILSKSEKFNPIEFEKIKVHPKYGLDIISSIDLNDDEIDFKILKNVIYQHHENCNGTGYPQKLTSERISPFAKIVSIVDFYDAITTKRPNCDVLSIENALSLMEKSTNKKIDASFYNEFRKLFKDTAFDANDKRSLIDEFDPCLPNFKLPLVYEQEIIDDKTIVDERKIGINNLKNFLIIDADESFVTAMSQFLRRIHISCQITSAASGITGLNLLRSHLGKYDYVFIDIKLPELNGINILRELSRHHEENINSFIYIISTSDINKLEDINFISGFINKPFTFPHFESIFF